MVSVGSVKNKHILESDFIHLYETCNVMIFLDGPSTFAIYYHAYYYAN